jgi:hypothetical protein
MTRRGLWSGALALLLLAPEASLAQQMPEAAPAQAFAPPIAQPMTYRVTTRRVSRSGTLISFALVYALQWQGAGRGYRLDTILRRIESDARPELVGKLTALFQPMVGETISYLVDAGGRSIALADPSQLWARVGQRTQEIAAAATTPEAQQIAALLAALPEAERDKLLTADIRALVAPANASIPMVASDDVDIRQEGDHRIVAKSERAELASGALDIDTLWTVDTAAGLVLTERRQSWTREPGTDARTLVEERIRALTLGDPGSDPR